MSFVTLEHRGPVGLITMNRPEALNALNDQVLRELDAVLDQVEADDSILVAVITGAGRSFVAGADIGEMKGFLKGMRLDNHSLKRISLLLEELSADLPTEPYPLRKKLSTIGQEATEQLLLLQSILRPASPHAETKAALEKILAAGDCLSLKTLALTGQDLMALGAPHGKILGTILAELLDIVLRAPEKNTKETLTALALALLEEL